MASKERLASNPIVQKSLDIFWRLQVLSLALKHDTKEKRRTKATAASKEQRVRLAKQLLCTWSKHNQVSSHFYFILLVSPVIGRVTATAWRQLLRARNSPFPHTPGTTSPTLYEQSGGSLTSHRIHICKGCETGPTVLSSLSEKTRKSNRLQMSLQRQHFLLSYLKTLSVGPAGTWTSGLPLGRPALIPLS